MPKRKHSEDEDSDKLWKKMRRIEKKLKKRKKRLRRKNSSSSDSSSPCNIVSPSIHEDVEDLYLPMYEVHGDLENLDTSSVAPGEACLPPSSDEANTQVPPTDAAPSAQAPLAPTTETAGTTSDEIVLDEDILEFLGETPSKDKKYGPKLQNEIANRWEHVATSGVSKEVKKEFKQRYLTPENCKLIDPPALNLEVKAALSDSLQKKDVAIQNKQKQIAAAVSCIAEALKRALSQNQKDSELIKLLIDAGRIVCDVQHTESMIRRGFIGSYIKKEVKDHLNDTQIDKFLYGEKLADTLKAAKSINKSGSEIRQYASTSASTRPTQKSRHSSQSLNSRVPATASRLPSAGRRYGEWAPAPAPASAPGPPPPAPRRRAPAPPPPQPPPPPPPPPPAARSQQRPRPPRR